MNFFPVTPKKVTTTPLLDFLKQRKQEKQRMRDEKREEKRRRDLERKRTKDDPMVAKVRFSKFIDKQAVFEKKILILFLSLGFEKL